MTDLRKWCVTCLAKINNNNDSNNDDPNDLFKPKLITKQRPKTLFYSQQWYIKLLYI